MKFRCKYIGNFLWTKAIFLKRECKVNTQLKKAMFIKRLGNVVKPVKKFKKY